MSGWGVCVLGGGGVDRGTVHIRVNKDTVSVRVVWGVG